MDHPYRPLRGLAFLAFLVLVPGLANAQTVFASFPTSESTLSFGILAGDADLAGTAILSPSTQSVTVTGGTFSFGGTVSAPLFRVSRDGSGGNNPLSVTISWNSSIIVSNGAQTATVNPITCHVVASNANDAFNCTNGGTVGLRRDQFVDFRLGGTLSLAANQAAGAYTGTLTVTTNP